MADHSQVFHMQDISVTRGDVEILSGIDWLVRRGQHWVVLGGNGSGKTSLLRVLMGYFTPSDGEVILPGRSEAVTTGNQEWDAWRKKFGFVSSSVAEMIEPAEPAVDVVMGGRHAMINYWQKDASVIERDRAAAMRVLKKVQCGHLAGQCWGYLSQGERQRVLIGRALMTPRLDVLILDEPCAGLDPLAREHFLHFIQELTGKGSFHSLIMVTHHVEEIIPDITHALLLRDGRTVESGPKNHTLTSPAISRTFGGDLKLRSREGWYRLYFEREENAPGIVV